MKIKPLLPAALAVFFSLATLASAAPEKVNALNFARAELTCISRGL